MRTILVSEKRRWQNQLARAAAQIPTIEEETELELENPGYQSKGPPTYR